MAVIFPPTNRETGASTASPAGGKLLLLCGGGGTSKASFTLPPPHTHTLSPSPFPLLAGGKLLVLCGGTIKTSATDTAGCEVAVLNAETGVWDRPSTGRLFTPVQGQGSTVVARTKVMTLGGLKGEQPSADIAVFNTDTMKWFTPQVLSG